LERNASNMRGGSSLPDNNARRNCINERTFRQIAKVLPSNGKQDPDRNEVIAEVAVSALTLLTALAKPRRKNEFAPVRLEVKELRNVLQMAEKSDRQEFVWQLGEVKDAIGEWHDWEVLVAIAKTVIEHGSNCGLLDDLGNIADRKYHKALTLTEDMRRKFLPMSDRRNKSSPRHAAFRTTEPVWLATAALVA
jgi:hypothetical protein